MRIEAIEAQVARFTRKQVLDGLQQEYQEFTYDVVALLSEHGHLIVAIDGGRGEWDVTDAGPYWCRLRGFGGENTIHVEMMPIQGGFMHIFVYETAVNSPTEVFYNDTVEVGHELEELTRAIAERRYL